MPSDLVCAQACLDSYGNPSVFDVWCDGSTTDEVVCGLKVYPDCAVLALRGSRTFLDWIRDFCAAMIQTDIGGVEAGFYIGLTLTLSMLLPVLPKDRMIYITGHSLGGGRAQQIGAKLIKLGYKVIIVTFGSPRPGDSVLASLVNTVPNIGYKNGPDYVTDVPIPIHPLLPYVHPSTRAPLSAAPPEGHPWGLLAWHDMVLYVKALQNGKSAS